MPDKKLTSFKKLLNKKIFVHTVNGEKYKGLCRNVNNFEVTIETKAYSVVLAKSEITAVEEL